MYFANSNHNMKLLICLLLLLSPVCLAQKFTFNQGGTDAKNYYEEIPYENINGKIFLEGEIAGKKHRFLFDTGAPVAISKELAAELSAKVIHKDIIGDAYLHKDSVTTVELNDLKLGGLTFNHIPAVTLFPDFYKCYHIDGVIGSNLLRNSIVSIVDSKHIIIFTDQKSKLNLKSKNSVPLISNVGLQSDPQIKMVMKDKVTITIPFDTGDNDFLRINDKMITSLKQYAWFDTLATGFGASGISAMGLQNAANKYLFKVAFLTVGNGRFNNLIVESNQDAIPAIGSKLLNYGTVTLDYINGKFYFDATESVTDLGEKQWPFRPAFADNKFAVGIVWQKAVGLLKQGEQIMAIDGTDYSNFTLCDLITAKPPLYGKESAVITLKDAQGNIRKISIKKE
jgi:hypothetical protein